MRSSPSRQHAARPIADPARAAAGTPGKAHVELRNVTRYFGAVGEAGSVHALGPLSFALRKGEFFGVVGPSGCGKSTLLEIIAGLGVVTEGEVFFEGSPIHGEVPQGVGIVFQEDASFPWLTVWDNIAFGLRRSGFDGNETSIPRTDVREAKPTGVSLMPEGLLTGMSDQELRDFFAYLRIPQPITR